MAQPDHADHQRAVRAIASIGKALEKTGFRAYAERLLFPPASPRQEALVRARRDWVLFHRRRRSSCDCCPPAVAAPARTYAVYHTREESPWNTLAEMRDVISGEVPILREALEFIQGVQPSPVFRGGTAELLTDPGKILAGWSQAKPAETLIYAVVAGAAAGAVDSAALLEERLSRLVSVVEGVTPASEAVQEVLPRVAPEFDPAGADGVMVLVTRARAAQDAFVEG